MIVVCKKEYKNMKVGQITEFVPGQNDDFIPTEFFGHLIHLPGEIYFAFIYDVEFLEHFCTLKEYRKQKIEKLQ